MIAENDAKIAHLEKMTRIEKDMYLSVPKTSKYLEPRRGNLMQEHPMRPSMAEQKSLNVYSSDGVEERSAYNASSDDHVVTDRNGRRPGFLVSKMNDQPYSNDPRASRTSAAYPQFFYQKLAEDLDLKVMTNGVISSSATSQELQAE